MLYLSLSSLIHWSFSIASFFWQSGPASAASSCIKTSILAYSLWNTSPHLKIFGCDFLTTRCRWLCQPSEWLIVCGPSVSYKYRSAVWNVPAIHVIINICNEFIDFLVTLEYLLFYPCHVSQTKRMGGNSRAAVLHINDFSCSIFLFALDLQTNVLNFSPNCQEEILITFFICRYWKIHLYYLIDDNKVSNHSLRFEM